MVHYCCVYDCKNNSTTDEFSFHGFPKDEKLVKVGISYLSFCRVESNIYVCVSMLSFVYFRCCSKVWISRIRRDPKRDFKVTKSTKVCSEHFTPEDFISTSSQKKRLKEGACPSVFSWSSKSQVRSLPSKRLKI